jgi:hypothetical protein
MQIQIGREWQTMADHGEPTFSQSLEHYSVSRPHLIKAQIGHAMEF